LVDGIHITDSTYASKIDNEISTISDKLSFQKQKIESDFTMLIKTQEGFAKLPDWKYLNRLNFVNSTIGGIPENEEYEKRNVASYLINEFGFQSFGITSVDGQMYLLEPFKDQLSLSKYNFADREWFKGVLNSENTFISDVFVSSATNHPVIVVSAPLFSEQGDLIGMWGGSVDLEFLTSYLDNLHEASTSVVLIDENDLVISDTSNYKYHGKSPDYLLNSKSSQNNYSFDTDSGQHIFHTVVQLQNKQWDLFATITDADFLPLAKQQRSESFYLIFLMHGFLILVAVFIFKNIRKNYRLTQSLQENQNQLIKNERIVTIGKIGANFVHDLKNPLTVIKGSFDILKMQKSQLNEFEEKQYNKIQDAIMQIDYLTRDVLEFSQFKEPKKKKSVCWKLSIMQ